MLCVFHILEHWQSGNYCIVELAFHMCILFICTFMGHLYKITFSVGQTGKRRSSGRIPRKNIQQAQLKILSSLVQKRLADPWEGLEVIIFFQCGLIHVLCLWSQEFVGHFFFLYICQKYQTKKMGLGLRTTRPFVKGEVVAQYTGEFIRYTEARRRAGERKSNNCPGDYIFQFPFKGKTYW